MSTNLILISHVGCIKTKHIVRAKKMIKWMICDALNKWTTKTLTKKKRSSRIDRESQP